MTFDDLPELLTLAFLEDHGIARADVRRRCPWAVEHGPAHAPYWHREELPAPLIQEERGDDQ